MKGRWVAMVVLGAVLVGAVGAVREAQAADPDTTWREELRVRFPSAGVVNLAGLRTSDGYAVGDVWNNNGTLRVCVVTTTSSTSTTSSSSTSTSTTSSTTSTSTTTTSTTTAGS